MEFLNSHPALFLIPAAAYLAGSVNFAILVAHLTKTEDLRKKHSGNPGVVNVYRVMGPGYAVVVLILDVGRAAAVGLAALYFKEPHLAPIVGLALILGNRFPLFHGFKGGKGVAAYLGFCAVTAPVAAAISAACWVLVFGVIRIPYIASFFMIAILAGGGAYYGEFNVTATVGAAATFGLIVWAHRGNISRHRADRMKSKTSKKQEES